MKLLTFAKLITVSLTLKCEGFRSSRGVGAGRGLAAGVTVQTQGLGEKLLKIDLLTKKKGDLKSGGEEGAA